MESTIFVKKTIAFLKAALIHIRALANDFCLKLGNSKTDELFKTVSTIRSLQRLHNWVRLSYNVLQDDSLRPTLPTHNKVEHKTRIRSWFARQGWAGVIAEQAGTSAIWRYRKKQILHRAQPSQSSQMSSCRDPPNFSSSSPDRWRSLGYSCRCLE